MNGVHDMGGMHGFGPVEPEANEPVFHHRWEARTRAITKALGSWGKWNPDYGRHQRELIPPAEYLRMSYYEKWLTALAGQIVKVGLVTREELESGQPAPGTSKTTPPLTVEGVDEATAKRFYRDGSNVRLVAENENYEPIIVNADQVELVGRVVGVLRQL